MRGYRAHLDGLRGVAIALVLLAHFGHGVTGVPGGAGYVGVGLFFALSGYLITALLLDEHGRGRVDLFAFYARRAGRLVPGLAVMVGVTSVLFARAGVNVAHSAVAAVTYSTNYATATGGLAGDPFTQTWSLAVEEHFYLLWAPALVLAARRNGTRGVLRAALLGAAMSLLWRVGLALSGAGALWVTRESFARGDALLLGCAAAAAMRLGWRVPRRAGGLAGVALVGLVFAMPAYDRLDATVPAALRLAGELGLIAAASTLVVVALEQRGGAAVLSWRPLVLLGVMSYSVYLWHNPVLSLLYDRWPRLAVLAVSLAAAGASYYAVERPARDAMRACLARRRSGVGSRVAPLEIG